MRFLLQVITVCVLISLPVTAGYYYEAVTQDDQGNTIKVKAWITGQHAKIVFEESDNPMTKEGSYMVTSDGGQTLYMVNDKDKTYTKFDLAAMANFAGNAMQGVVNMEISDPEVKQLEKKAGGGFHGINTTYYKFRTKYDMKVKVIGIKRTSQIDTVSETWVTDKVMDQAFGAWLRVDKPTGNEEIDKLMRAQMSTVKGFPMKQITVTTTRQLNRRGKVKDENTVRSTTEVTVFREEAVDKSISNIPEGYEEVQMFGGDEEGGNPFKNIFNKN